MALEKYEDWQAPWEKKGEDFDAETAKKYVYNTLRDREDTREQIETIRKERDGLLEKVDGVDPKNAEQIETLRKEVAAAREQAEKDLHAERMRAARLELAVEHGLTASQARRLQGDTPEDLKADAEELKKDLFGGEQKSGDDGPAPRGPFRTGAGEYESEASNPSQALEHF